MNDLEKALAQVAVLREALRLLRSCVQETGGVPRYTVTSGAALNQCTAWADSALHQTEQAASDYVNRLRQSWALSSEAEAQQREATAREEALEEAIEVFKARYGRFITAATIATERDIRALARKVGEK